MSARIRIAECMPKISNSYWRSIVHKLGELLKYVTVYMDNGNRNDKSAHDLEMNQTNELPQSLPFVLSFTNLTYSVEVRSKFGLPAIFRHPNSAAVPATVADPVGRDHLSSMNKVLLNDISGEAREGEILAVLGASGAGKSTLIDALANRIAKGSLKGNVTLNGEQLESKLLKVISAYVMQDDLLFPMLTVEETLMFAAEFRLPQTLSKSKKKQRVQALIDHLGLRSAANTIIGDEGHRGVSGGERRRVSIGTDIIHDPIILFLDEPTSGLDSTSAYMVVKVLQRIAQTGSIVIMSVHQPSYRLLGLFDRLWFLSRGQTVYSGSPSNLLSFFEDFGRPIPDKENGTEFALDLIRELEGSPEGTKSLVDFNKSWQIKRRSRHNAIGYETPTHGLSLKEVISASISRGKLVSGVTNNDSSSSKVHRFANPIWMEMIVLSKRSFINSWRMPELFGTRLGAVMVTGFILATMFWKLDDSPRGVRERIGFFAFTISTTFFSCADALPVFIQERFIFMRETAYNGYRRSSYVLSHSLVAIPSYVFLSFTFAIITFSAVGLDGGASGFFFYFTIIWASFWAGNSFVTFLSAVVPHVMIGYVIVLALLAQFLLFSGFFISRDRIPDYWIWFHYLSLVKYPYQAVLHNEFEDPTKCFVRGTQIFDGSPLADFDYSLILKLLDNVSETLGFNITVKTCVTTGADILRQQGVTDFGKWGCLFITVAWGFLFRILFYFSLLIGSKNKRS
ncbi:pigment precursor permease, P-loop containing nucleoside triphosphate hydrolase [Artemisia annua]|uniref:Pigment permease, P-loop containing nucleoside triphosphate hydrolase n=1 Tax=Artemisia annua TaxID=35608 RepID=A0A2U1QNE4_ARTAN|nr:pigment precursor permease, P-loop containing nucleoside triphosphate hydrolase [Artemisia annua]